MSFDFHYLWTWTQNVLEVKSVLSIFLQIPWATNTTWCQSKQQQPRMRLSLALIPHSQVADQAHQTIVNTAKFKHHIFSLLFLDVFGFNLGSSIQVAASTTWCILRFGSIFTFFSCPRRILGLAAANSWLNKKPVPVCSLRFKSFSTHKKPKWSCTTKRSL